MTIQYVIILLNMSLFSKLSLIKVPLVFATIVVLLFGFFCVGMFQPMPADMHDSNVTTISDKSPSGCCGTSLSSHLGVWKNTFTVTPRDLDGLLLTLILTFFVILAVWNPPTRIYLSSILSSQYKLYVRQHPNLKTFSALQLAFSNGILNPKLY